MSIIEQWRQISDNRSGWFWLVGALRNGDIYHICSLAASFRQNYGKQNPLYLVVTHPFQANVAALFSEDFDEIIIGGQFPVSREGWEPFFEETSLPRFGLNIPIIPHPNFHVWGQSAIEMAAQTHRTWMDIYKKLLHVPNDSEPSVPQAKPELRAEARALCEEAMMPLGRSVLLFPYAQSLPMPTLQYFAKLADDLCADGYAVYTSVANDEAPVPGTTPIHLPFNLLIDIAEYAGWIVAIRSGICDITSSARCRKTYIYPNLSTLLAWGVGAMELARDADEFSYPFVGDPNYFSRLVRAGASMAPLAIPPRRLSALVGRSTGESIKSLSFSRCSASELEQMCQTVCSAKLDAFVIFDVPGRRHMRLAGIVDNLFDGLKRNAADICVYACRDASPYGFFEPISGANLISRRYVASNYWHSLVVTANQDGRHLSDMLPTYAHGSLLLAPTKMRADRRIRIGDYYGSLEQVDAACQGRPLTINGMHFMEGWSGLEPWGLWSEGLRPTIKLITEERLEPGTVFHIEASACVSEVFPQIVAHVMVNGHIAARSVLTSPYRNEIVLPVGNLCPGETDLTITFRLDEIRSPHEQGGPSDGRKLGLGFICAELCTHFEIVAQ